MSTTIEAAQAVADAATAYGRAVAFDTEITAVATAQRHAVKKLGRDDITALLDGMDGYRSPDIGGAQ